MRLKHNKKRNTAFVYEALVRELTESIVKNKKDKQNKIVSIIKEHFSKNTLLNKELGIYQAVYDTKQVDRKLAEKIVLEAKEEYASLNKGKIFKEQSALINKINKTISSKIFNNFLPNYRSIASVYSIFNNSLPVKDRVLLEENLVEQMSASAETLGEQNQKPIDNIVYKSFVNKFNEEYSGKLAEEQKDLLVRYISSFSDNGLQMKTYLNEEVGRLKSKLSKVKTNKHVKADNEMVLKIGKVHSLLEGCKEREMDVDMLELVLKTQELVNEIEEDDNKG